MALAWKARIFRGTNVGIILLVNLLLPLSLASWTFFIATPFGRSPQLSAITSVLASFVFAIFALVLKGAGNGMAFIFTILFPSGFYVFVIRAICGFENRQIPTSLVKADPDHNLRVIVPVIAAIVCPPYSIFYAKADTRYSQINIFLWPYLAVLLERKLYDPPNPLGRTWFGKKKPNPADGATMPPDMAISIQNLGKDFAPPLFSGKERVTAVEDLSFNVPKNGIFVLLGSNGYETSPRCLTDSLKFRLIQCRKIDLLVNHWQITQPHAWSYPFRRGQRRSTSRYHRDCSTEERVVPRVDLSPNFEALARGQSDHGGPRGRHRSVT